MFLAEQLEERKNNDNIEQTENRPNVSAEEEITFLARRIAP